VGGTCGTHGGGEGAYRKRTLGRPRCSWQDNIKMNLRETGIDGAN
jgi:hypothetical protein